MTEREKATVYPVYLDDLEKVKNEVKRRGIKIAVQKMQVHLASKTGDSKEFDRNKQRLDMFVEETGIEVIDRVEDCLTITDRFKF